VPTIASSLDARYLSGMRAERLAAAKVLHGPSVPRHPQPQALVEDVRQALYAAKICSYAQGMNMLRAASKSYNWNLQLGRIARIWKGGCIIRARFLNRITQAFQRDADLANLMIDGEFARELSERQAGWRRVLANAVGSGIPVPTFAASLSYYD